MKVLARYLDILLPPTLLTGDAAVALTDWAPSLPGEYCGRCGASVSAAAITDDGCPHCRDERIAWHGLWRLGAYSDPLDGWIRDCKFHGAWAWGPWFGRRLAGRTPDYPGDKVTVVPVPLHWRRRIVRGYDQSRLMARAFAKAKDLPLTRILKRVRNTRQQSRIQSHEARKANVRSAFRLATVDLTGWTVWLIDDVKTSGATAHVCTRLLQRAGAKRVNVAVAAVADPRGADFQRN
jgi:ComF family protein